MNTIDLEVQGMNCGACVKHVTQALQPLTGVSAVDVDLKNNCVHVSGDLAQGGDALVYALTAAGYPAKLSASTAPVSQPKKLSEGCCCG